MTSGGVYMTRRRRSTWPQASADAGRGRRAGMAGRVRVLGGFAAFGAFWGAWGATLPAIQSHAGVDDGQLGVALLFIGAGALVAMRGAGTLVDGGAPRRCLRCWPRSPARRCFQGWPPRRRPCAPPCSSWARRPARSTSRSTPRARAPRRAAAGRCSASPTGRSRPAWWRAASRRARCAPPAPARCSCSSSWPSSWPPWPWCSCAPRPPRPRPRPREDRYARSRACS